MLKMCLWFCFRDLSSGNEIERAKPFIIRAPEYEMEDTESEDEEEKTLVPGKRFTCDEHYLRCLLLNS